MSATTRPSRPPTDGCDSARERELRLALVCYGGVSLAVYMYGVTGEILKLVRASRAYHALAPEQRATAHYKDALNRRSPNRQTDTEALYFELLQQLGGSVALRVVVDVVAGASAGGITGIMLARALAFDLNLEQLRSFWLDLADVTELLDPEARAGSWSKFYMRPAFWVAGLWRRRQARKLGRPVEDPAVLRNLSLFMRSRWFEPPFSGRRMSEMMYDALAALGDEQDSPGTLLPRGLPLELFVTTTDFWGYRQAIRLHDPTQVLEREHRHILHFRHLRQTSGEFASELAREHLASLAFAARATSSFPGAFPPTRLQEMDQLLQKKGLAWPARGAFLAHQFAALTSAGENPEDAAFIDGSVLMNKPISLALQAIQRHVAHRETDRRLVYLEPKPDTERASAAEVPDFFRTLKGALSDIPRNQPIRDDLEWIEQFNDQVGQQRQVIEAVKPQVMHMIANALGERLAEAPDAERLHKLRSAANARAAGDAAYAYEGYARLKVVSLLDDLGRLLWKGSVNETHTRAQALVNDWAVAQHILPMGQAATDAQWGDDVAWISFLRRFDIRHRLRRVLLLIRRCNDLYNDADLPCSADTARWLDQLKAELYLFAEQLRELLQWRDVSIPDAGQGALHAPAQLAAALASIGDQLDLAGVDDRLDHCLARFAANCPQRELYKEVIIAYLGFAYYDVLTYPMAQSRDLDALEEIKVDRIAVDDANSLRKGSSRQLLKGAELGSFGAFFSRRFRENDYLWGRLSAAERLVDIVASAAPDAIREQQVDLPAIKQRLFLKILEVEEPQLGQVGDLIAELRQDAMRMTTGSLRAATAAPAAGSESIKSNPDDSNSLS